MQTLCCLCCNPAFVEVYAHPGKHVYQSKGNDGSYNCRPVPDTSNITWVTSERLKYVISKATSPLWYFYQATTNPTVITSGKYEVRMARKLCVAALGVILSAGIAAVSFAFIIAETYLTDLVWHTPFAHGQFAIVHHVIVCAIGLAIVFALKQHWGDLPHTTHDSMAELKRSHSASYHHVWRSLIVAIAILVTGAGVGPEASLLGAIIALSIFQADKLRYLYHHFDEFQKASWGTKFAYAFHPHQYLLPFNAAQYRINKRKKQALVSLFIINGVVMFTLLMRLAHQPSFVTRVGQTDWQLHDLIILPLLCLAGAVVGKLYMGVRRASSALAKHIHISRLSKLSIGALAIFAMSAFAPELLFSGQHEISFVIDAWTLYPAWVLLLLAMGKLIFLDICNWSGWIGGDIFPILFSSLLLGFSAAQLMPTYDTLLVCIVVAVSVSTMMVDLPWVMCIIVALFFPLSLLPIAVLATALLQGVRWGITKVMKLVHIPTSKSVSHH